MRIQKSTNRNDLILISCILLIAIIFIFAQQVLNRDIDLVYGKVLFNGDVVKEVSLLQDKTFSVEEVPQVIFEIRDGNIGFVYSDCPDQICVDAGFLHRSGQATACLPFGLTLLVSGTTNQNDDIDIFN